MHSIVRDSYVALLGACLFVIGCSQAHDTRESPGSSETTDPAKAVGFGVTRAATATVESTPDLSPDTSLGVTALAETVVWEHRD